MNCPPVDGRPRKIRECASHVHGRLSPSLIQFGSPNDLATEYLSDVGSLSGRASARIRPITGRHSLLPTSCPAHPWASLAVGLPWPMTTTTGTTLASGEGEKIGCPHDRNDPSRCSSIERREERSGQSHLRAGSSLTASLARSCMTVGHRRFSSLHHARSLALTEIEAPRKALLSRDFEPRVTSTLRHIVRVALDSDP